jgi:hypothetical protein
VRVTEWAGPSSESRLFSVEGEPIRNVPAGIRTRTSDTPPGSAQVSSAGGSTATSALATTANGSPETLWMTVA